MPRITNQITIMRNIFLLPCIPYHLSVFVWVNYLAFRDNDFKEMLMNGDIKRNKKFDDFIDMFDKKSMHIQYAYCIIFWLWLFLKLF